MQIFLPIADDNGADNANGSQIVSYTHVDKDLNRNEHFKSKFKSGVKHLINSSFSFAAAH